MKNIYGYIETFSGQFVETGYTEKGAKIAATKREIKENNSDHVVVGYRSCINNMFIATAKKYNSYDEWLKIVYF